LHYEGKKVEINEGIHSLNLLGENNLEGVKKPFQKYHLLIDGACVGISIYYLFFNLKSWSSSSFSRKNK
jgi:hypothetical protein